MIEAQSGDQAPKNEETILFPRSVQRGMVFSSPEELLALVEADARALSFTWKSIYVLRFIPKKTNYRALQLNCKHCSAHANFAHKGSQLVATTVHHEHVHGPVRFANRIEQQIYEMYRETKEKSPKEMPLLKSRVLRDFYITKGACFKLLRKFKETESRGFSETLETWLKDNAYEYQLQWGIEPRNRYPLLLLMTSPTMRQNYKRFGDLVSFDITYGLLRNVTADLKRYKVGVFSFNDTNLRILLVGVAFLVDETKENFFELFQMFFNLHGRPFGTLITDDQPAIASAVNTLRANEFFIGSHMLDPWHLLKVAKPKIKDSKEEVNKWLSLIQEAIQERNSDDFKKEISDLRKFPQTKEV